MTKFWFAFVVLVTGCYLVDGLPYISLPETTGVEVKGFVLETEASRSRRSVNGFPPKISLDLSSNGLNTHLELLENPSISDDVPVLLMHDNRIKKYRVDKKEKVAFYEDRAQVAAVMVSRKEGDNYADEFKYFGTFVNVDGQFLVQPDADDTGYTISRLHEELAADMDFEIQPNLDPSGMNEASTNKEDMNQTSHRHKREDFNYEVEIFFVIDYSVYLFWYEQTSGGETERRLAAIDHIIQFYAFVLNAINIRYESVIGNGYTLSCIYAGIYIAENVEAASFVEPNLINVGLPKLAFRADVVIEDFRDWAETNILPIFNYDHAMMFSGYEMGSVNGNVFSQSTAGLAYLGGACTYNKYSINEASLRSGMATVAAHKLGHNLNALHDNRSANACNEDDGYIMAPSSGASGNLSKNLLAFEFSSCSLGYFDEYITSLNSDGSNCLTTRNANYNTSDMDSFLNDLAGQVISPDLQCEHSRGNGSFLYRSNISITRS